MPNQYFFSSRIEGNVLFLEDIEASHCALVLRKNIGDVIGVLDGKGNDFEVQIQSINRKEVSCEILKVQNHSVAQVLHIAIAPPKSRERLEWMIEKLVEIGVASITLLKTKRSERSAWNKDRLEKKILSAMKQSKQFYKPSLEESNFSDILESPIINKFIAHCNPFESEASLSTKNESIICIGPEGDFTEDEVKMARKNGFSELNLGASRLRTETAAIYVASLFR